MLAYSEGKPVGYAYANRIERGDRYWQRTTPDPGDEYTAQPTLALKEIGVRPAWRGTGTARRIHDELLAASDERYVTLMVNSSAGDGKVHTLYRSWGYVDIGTSQPSPASPQLTVMVRAVRWGATRWTNPWRTTPALAGTTTCRPGAGGCPAQTPLAGTTTGGTSTRPAGPEHPRPCGDYAAMMPSAGPTSGTPPPRGDHPIGRSLLDGRPGTAPPSRDHTFLPATFTGPMGTPPPSRGPPFPTCTFRRPLPSLCPSPPLPLDPQPTHPPPTPPPNPRTHPRQPPLTPATASPSPQPPPPPVSPPPTSDKSAPNGSSP